jgi:hypothetical protein
MGRGRPARSELQSRGATAGFRFGANYDAKPFVDRHGIDRHGIDRDGMTATASNAAPIGPQGVFTKLYATDKPRKFGSFTFRVVGDRLGRRAK